MSLGWARETGEGEFEHGLERASLKSLDTLSRGLDVEQRRLQKLYGEFPEGSEQGRFIKRQIREVAGRSGSVKASAMFAATRTTRSVQTSTARDAESSNRRRNPDQRDKTP